MQTETWILGWGCFVVVLAVLRARRRRLEWRNQPGLTVVSTSDPSPKNPTPPKLTKAEVAAAKDRVEQEESASLPAETDANTLAEADLSCVVHIVPNDVSEYVITDFHANLDTCKIDLHNPDIDFVHWRAQGMAAMMFRDGDETLTVFFQGSDVVPFNDVFVRFDHPRNGPQGYFLSDLLDPRESEITQDEAALMLDATRDALQAADGFDEAPKKFHDFDTKKECIEVFVPEDRIATTAVSISSTPDGSDALVLVDGRIAAVLIGAIDAGPHNIKLVAGDQTVAA
ncbi:MAG: hypothetical protein HKP37_02570 [Boseongicola sp.]|nr:hypothetical protein [Boseongicola sp.]NNL17603.1 hypothetical protein [Boseongicola sp.]